MPDAERNAKQGAGRGAERSSERGTKQGAERNAERESFYRALSQGDHQTVLTRFDSNQHRVLRHLARLTYLFDDTLRDQSIAALQMLAERRARHCPEFFREVIRRHIWGMNEEGGNIDWSAPEIIAAVIAGQPELYREFVSIMYLAAVDEPVFQDSLARALKLLEASDPTLLEGLWRDDGVKQVIRGFPGPAR
jgi:hypothetical protein